MGVAEDLANLAPVAAVPPQNSWIKDLIDKRYQPQTERLKRSPMGFDFKGNPFDPSSYYRSLQLAKNISTSATDVTRQEAANKEASERQAQYDQNQQAMQDSLGGVSANFTYSASGKVGSIIASGMKQLGKPYVFGDEGPNTFDCSGLMQFIFKKNGISLPRTAAQQQKVAKRVGKPVAGDLVFYGYPAHHVALYLGNGKMLAAPHAGANVRVQPVYGKPTYGRI